MEATPKTLVDLGLFNRSNKLSTFEKEFQDAMEFEFHDVNEEYEEATRMNKITEMAYIASTKHLSLADDT